MTASPVLISDEPSSIGQDFSIGHAIRGPSAREPVLADFEVPVRVNPVTALATFHVLLPFS